jgi:hypothetical protein
MEALLDRIEQAAEGREGVSLGRLMEFVGRSSFGPFLLIPGLVTLAPLIGDIPGVPTVMGLFVLLSAGQLLLGREQFWLPGWVLERSVDREKLEKAVSWLRRPSRWIDRVMRPRLERFTGGTGAYVSAAMCALIAVAMPFMEFVPFSANGAGAALTAHGLGLVTRDGLVMLLAFAITVATFVVIPLALL